MPKTPLRCSAASPRRENPYPTPSNCVTIVGSLFAQAVILYARATETTPIERGRWFGRDKLKGDDRALHIEVMDLGDHALAHSGKAALLANWPLVREPLVISVIGRNH